MRGVQSVQPVQSSIAIGACVEDDRRPTLSNSVHEHARPAQSWPRGCDCEHGSKRLPKTFGTANFTTDARDVEASLPKRFQRSPFRHGKAIVYIAIWPAPVDVAIKETKGHGERCKANSAEAWQLS